MNVSIPIGTQIKSRGGGQSPCPPPCMADYDKFSCFEYHNIECENTITISMNLHKYINFDQKFLSISKFNKHL